MKKFIEDVFILLIASLGTSLLAWIGSLIIGNVLPLFVYFLIFAITFVVVTVSGYCYVQWKANKIGHYSFNTLYKILETEYVHETTNAMNWSNREPPKESLLKQFEMFHVILSGGLDYDSPLEDGSYLYSILCPKLYAYGLLSKERVQASTSPVEKYRYELSEDGKKFWARLIEKQINGTQ
jgi:hypothetical protein